ncbi:MAG: DEAD/DEAH box helicase family protein [Acidobacteriota bacterium]|nr:MAG: DEAD/DEAH box helicase family protein [Acidobacteriota bacterium]
MSENVEGQRLHLGFDRGTIVLRGLRSDTAARLPQVRWDSRVGVFRAPARHYAGVRAELEQLGIRFTDEVHPVVAAPAIWKAMDLRPYQEAGLCAWELDNRRGVVVLPTGAGKTRLAMAAISRTGSRALCLVPTRVLLEQWVRAIGENYLGPVGCFGDGERVLRPVTVATFESGYRYMDRIGNHFDLLIVDEAHHFGSGARDEALEMTIAAARLGLTATPPRRGPAPDRLDDLIGVVVFELAISDLAGSFLAPFETMTLRLDLTSDERRDYERWVQLYREPFRRFRQLHPGSSWETFVRAAARFDEGRRAIAAWRRSRRMLAYAQSKRKALRTLLARHRAQRVIVFVGDNETAYAIAREHLIMPFTCDIRRKERAVVLERFRKGELRALVSAQALNEGVDVPGAEIGIIVAGRRGEREHVQRVGRLLRPREGKRALIYEMVLRGTAEVGQAARRREGLVSRSSVTD